MPRINGAERQFGVFDSFSQRFVEGEVFRDIMAAIHKAGVYNLAYARRLA